MIVSDICPMMKAEHYYTLLLYANFPFVSSLSCSRIKDQVIYTKYSVNSSQPITEITRVKITSLNCYTFSKSKKFRDNLINFTKRLSIHINECYMLLNAHRACFKIPRSKYNTCISFDLHTKIYTMKVLPYPRLQCIHTQEDLVNP